MKVIKLYEEFTNKTLNINNSEYGLYFDGYKDDEDESKVVMWMTEGSQEANFSMVSKYIKSGNSVLDYGCGVGGFVKHLESKGIIVSDYLGVDINEKFIDTATEKHKEYKFKHITDSDELSDKWDDVVVIGVFTWYIERDEFIRTINKLYDIANNQLLITCNLGNFEDNKYFWKKEYRFYNEKIFLKLFPDYNITFDYDKNNNNTTLLVKIIK